VVLSSAQGPVEAAEALCHELAHVRLGVVLERDPLLVNAAEAGHRSPWRTDPRPLLGVLLGVHAFLDVCAYHRRLIETGLGDRACSEQIHARQATRVRQAWSLLRAVGRPTAAGERVLAALATQVEAL
jgi:HEXXH motif-containing protein